MILNELLNRNRARTQQHGPWAVTPETLRSLCRQPSLLLPDEWYWESIRLLLTPASNDASSF